MHTITPTRLSSQIKKNMRAQINTMIWGGPGIGKSDIPQQIANELNIKLLDFRANLFDPVDVRGIPHLRQIKETGDRYTSWAPPDIFPIESRDGAKGIMLIDELPTAPPATQNAFLQLLLTREVGNYKMPVGWSVISAGNRITDGAAVYQMPTPVRNRLAHYELEPTLDDWVTWAHQNNIDTDVIAFIQYRPNLLNAFDADQYAFPTPRTWAFVSKKLSVSDDNDDIDELFYDVSSLVGDGPAGEFVAFKEIANKLPDIDALIANPDLYKKDDNPALLYALANGLASRADDPKMENIMKVNKKIPIEFQVVLIKACLLRDKTLKSHNDIRKWITENANVIL
tara:strand:+ start:2141 stop:3163 length:1023 start_codon:yes stop_codon:yes gene_type:complete